ncbi:hypothetical protein ABH924_004385 [Arthrobacter sp. GAS37]|uniref:hypothetical protein n=1 Tax=Arthrobacter sp. GAS37 TaxID=3156261 RepID=UPI003832BD8B
MMYGWGGGIGIGGWLATGLMMLLFWGGIAAWWSSCCAGTTRADGVSTGHRMMIPSVSSMSVSRGARSTKRSSRRAALL